MELQNNIFSGLLFEDVPHTKPDSLNLPRIFLIEFYCIDILKCLYHFYLNAR